MACWQLGHGRNGTRHEIVGGINPLNESSFPANLIDVNGALYFTADDGVYGRQLWSVTASGLAVMVERAGNTGGINPNGNSYLANLTNVSGRLFFTAYDEANGQELWRVGPSGQAEIVQRAGDSGGS